jgi:hypothetical protein
MIVPRDTFAKVAQLKYWQNAMRARNTGSRSWLPITTFEMKQPTLHKTHIANVTYKTSINCYTIMNCAHVNLNTKQKNKKKIFTNYKKNKLQYKHIL